MNIRNLTVALLASFVFIAPLAANAQYNYNNNYNNQGYNHRHRMRNGWSRSGVIQSVNGSSFTLNNGTTVFMRNGTVINPTGTTLQPGMRVSIQGTRDGRGRLNASEVDVGNYRGHHAYNR